MKKQNCWEYFKCGREEGGKYASKLGVCPVSINPFHSGINHGKNAGRHCWTIEGTTCHNTKQGGLDDKLLDCLNCSFLKKVHHEEGREFILISDKVLEKLKAQNND